MLRNCIPRLKKRWMSQGNGDSPASVILYFQGPQNINGAGDRIDRQEKQHDYDVALGY